MATAKPEKSFLNYKFPEVPKTAPIIFPAAPSHNPDPSYRTNLIHVLNETSQEGKQIHKCLTEPREKQLAKLQQLIQLNKEAKALLIKDGYTNFSGGRRRKTRRFPPYGPRRRQNKRKTRRFPPYGPRR